MSAIVEFQALRANSIKCLSLELQRLVSSLDTHLENYTNSSTAHDQVQAVEYLQTLSTEIIDKGVDLKYFARQL